jgi:uncharacterized protein YkwD
MIRCLWPLSGIVALLMLSACGGGSDASAAPATPAVTNSTTGMTASTLSSASQAGGDTTCGLAGFRAELLSRINNLRAQGATCGSNGSFPPVAALLWQTQLGQAAAAHSLEMAVTPYFSHTDLGGHDAGYRMMQAGYAWSAWAENIAAGQGSVDAVMAAWISSPGHCTNLMSSRVTQVGVACVRDADGRPYWTMNLGKPAAG